MAVEPSESALSLPPVDLDLQLVDGRLYDPVDADAARALGARQCRDTGLIPFAWDGWTLKVGTTWPMSPEAEQLLDRLDMSVRLHQAEPLAIARAQQRVFGASGRVSKESVPRFGELAVRLGKTDPTRVADALAVQNRQGGRVGQLLTLAGRLTHWDVAEIVAYQANLPLVNLLGQREVSRLAAWDLMPKDYWKRHRIVPVADTGDVLTVAMEDPEDQEAVGQLRARTGRDIRRVVTGQRDVTYLLERRYGREDLELSRDGLAVARPEDSAKTLWTRAQKVALATASVSFLALLAWHAVLALAVVNSLLIVGYAVTVGYRFNILRRSTGHLLETEVTPEEIAALDERSLPTYTILIPARDEVSVLPILTRALDDLDYPKDRLDVKLLLEQDDVETIEAAFRAHLPPYVEIVVVPADEPRTKPKACNFGLQKARGQYLVIFDAEDIPEPDQLKKAIVLFRRGDPALACVQAKLSYFNRDQNLLTRWFTAEYAAWFELFLPALHAVRHPIPLGGTSNHFRTAVLRGLGGWDPYNVTEDADLGIRLHKAGYRTEIMDAVTYEEANSEFVNWVRQRSRWVKGYLQTWLVHMRHPVKLYRQLGPRGFWGFQMAILGTPLMFLLNPLYWLLTTLWFGTQWGLIGHMFPPGIYYLGMVNLLLGNFIFTYLNAMASARRGDWDLVKYTLLSPLYWGMMSLASWKAVMQLVTRPSHWEKTTHGLIDLSRYRSWGHPVEQVDLS